MTAADDQPEVEQFQDFRIEYWRHQAPDTLGRLSRVLVFVFRDDTEVFRAAVDVTTRFAADPERRDRDARHFAHQLAHGLIHHDEYEDPDSLELTIGEGFDPASGDSSKPDERVRIELLDALRRMNAAQALTNTVLTLDVDGFALVGKVSADRVRGLIAELIAEGLVEGYAESFGATAVDGRCRITGDGLRYLRDRQEVPPTTESIIDWTIQPGTDWADLEVRMNGLKNELDNASDLDDFQDVGRRCREILIDAANLVFRDEMTPEGTEIPGTSDAKRRIDYYLAVAVPGRSHRELRKLMRQAYTLAQSVTHSDHADGPTAFAAAQATVLIVRTLQRIQAESG